MSETGGFDSCKHEPKQRGKAKDKLYKQHKGKYSNNCLTNQQMSSAAKSQFRFIGAKALKFDFNL